MNEPNLKKITLIQATMLEGSADYMGLLDVFLHQLSSTPLVNLFEPVVVVVPNLTTANWLKDKIALQLKICSNFEFITFEQLIKKYYQQGKPQNLFDFDDALFIIYDFLMSVDLGSESFDAVSQYILNEDGKTRNLAKAFQLAGQLKTIFHEYLYLRTGDLIAATLQKKLPRWQLCIWQSLTQQIAELQQDTYLDIYHYYQNSAQLIDIPAQIFIFNLNNIYPSGCEIINSIALHSCVSWYSLAISDKYYGDLLSSSSRAKLQQKILKEPFLSVADLSFTDGNQLVANLGQQLREFNELILANDINIVSLNAFNAERTSHVSSCEDALLQSQNLLTLIQHDIKQLTKRIVSEYWLNPHLGCYAEPVIFDMADESIIINVCYNRMREVQELFNQVCALLNTDKMLSLSDILIVAPDINEYGAYIDAVFGNEHVTTADGDFAKLPYVITGNILERDFKLIDCIKKIVNIPYEMPVSFLFDLLSQDKIMNCLDLDANDLSLIFVWIKDNKVRSGYDATDYAAYGYNNFDIHSLKRFLTNLTLGLAMSEDFVQGNSGPLPWLKLDQNAFTFYDNLETTQLELVDKLISVIDILLLVRSTVYSAPNKYKQLHLTNVINLVEQINLALKLEDDTELTLSEFIGKLKSIKLMAPINVPIINSIVDDYCSSFNTKVIFTGKLTFASMQAVRNIPGTAIFMLGINFGEFPRQHVPNKLSILAKEWAVADRNANLEDKQLFLDIILSAKKYLRISYIGRNQQDNSEIKPAPVLSLLLEVMQHSILNQEDMFKQIIKLHALHPFYNNTSLNYSVFWDNITPTINDLFINKRWSSTGKYPPIVLDQEQQKSFLNINLRSLINTFCYTNINLFRVVGVSKFKDDHSINDYEGFNLIDYELKNGVYYEFSKITLQNENLEKLYSSGELQQYLATKGILGYGGIGNYQFNMLYNLYQNYIKAANATSINLNYIDPQTNINLADKVELDAENNLIIVEDFVAIKSAPDMDNYPISYKLRIKCFLSLLLLHYAKFSHPCNGELVIPDGVVLKLISQEGNTINYRAEFAGNIDIMGKLFANVLGFYLYSLTNPVLIHRGAIISYLETAEDYKRIANTQKTYEVKFKNTELEQLCRDPIFCDIAGDYFNIYEPKDNTILIIGSILKNMQLIKL